MLDAIAIVMSNFGTFWKLLVRSFVALKAIS